MKKTEKKKFFPREWSGQVVKMSINFHPCLLTMCWAVSPLSHISFCTGTALPVQLFTLSYNSVFRIIAGFEICITTWNCSSRELLSEYISSCGRPFSGCLSIPVVTVGTREIAVKFGIGVPHCELLRLHNRHLNVVIPVVNRVFVVALTVYS